MNIKEILDNRVAILDGVTDVLIDEMVVREITKEFDLYITYRNEKLVLCNKKDDAHEHLLGETVEEVLDELSNLDEWYSDFKYLYDKAIEKDDNKGEQVAEATEEKKLLQLNDFIENLSSKWEVKKGFFFINGKANRK